MRLQSEVAEQKGHHQCRAERNHHQRDRSPSHGRIDGAQQRGAHAHVHGGEGRAIALQRRHHVKDPGRAEDLFIN
jgi:hypothetical protein